LVPSSSLWPRPGFAIESGRRSGRTTRLVDWAIHQARGGGPVVFVCAFPTEVVQVTDLVAATAAARGVLKRLRTRRHSVELVGGGSITVVFSGDPLAPLRGTCPKVAVDDWSEQQWSTKMYLHSWADEWWTEG
jgi:hypothetical protein